MALPHLTCHLNLDSSGNCISKAFGYQCAISYVTLKNNLISVLIKNRNCLCEVLDTVQWQYNTSELLIKCAGFVIGCITVNSPLFLPTLSPPPPPPAGSIRGEQPRSFLSLDTALLVPANNKDDFDSIYTCGCLFLCAKDYDLQ